MFGVPFPGPQGYMPQMQNTIRTPYASHDRYLRLEGQLVQLATADEAVKFHNLNVRAAPDPYASQRQYRGPSGASRYTPPPSYEIDVKPQTVVTPSGISVSLLPLSSLPPGQMGFGGLPDSLRLLLKIGPTRPVMGMEMPGMPPTALPRSPLYRKYHQPVTFSLRATRPYLLEEMFPGPCSWSRARISLICPIRTCPAFLSKASNSRSTSWRSMSRSPRPTAHGCFVPPMAAW